MASPEEWFRTLPPVTKSYFVAAVGTTLAVTFGIISPMHLYLDWEKVIYQFQIWRLITCFLFFGKFSMPFVFQIVLLVRYFRYLEEGYFIGGRGTAELVTVCAFGASLMLLLAYFWEGLFFLGPALVFMILYIWSRKDPYRQVVFYGFAFQAWHTPFLFLVLSMLLGANPVLDIVGILIGHIYYFLVDVVPQVYHVSLYKTPQFMYQLFEHGTVAAPQQRWQTGTGYRLD